MNYDIKKIIEDISIKEVFERLNFNITRGNKVLCPFHDDTKPSLVIYDESNQYHCYACDAHGNIFNIVMKELNYNFQEALDWLVKEFNIQGEGYYKRKKVSISPSEFNILDKFKDMNRLEKEKLKKFAEERGFNLEFLKAHSFSFALKNKIIRSISNKYDYIDDLVKRGYIYSNIDRKEEIYYTDFYLTQRVIIPIFDQYSNLSGIVARATSDDDKNPKYLYNKGFSKSKNLYNIDTVKKSVDEWRDGEFNLHITEGVFDALRIESLGDASVAILGASISKEQINLIDKVLNPIKGKTPINIYIFLDFDNAGYKGRLKAIKHFLVTELGIAANIRVILSEGELNKTSDPDNLLISVEKLQKYKKNSVSAYEFLFRYFIEDESVDFKIKDDNDVLVAFNNLNYFQKLELLKLIRSEFSRKALDFLFTRQEVLKLVEDKFQNLLFNDYTKYLYNKVSISTSSDNSNIDKLKALRFARNSYKREEINLDEDTWDRIELNSDLILNYICDFNNQKEVKHPLVAFDVPKKINGEDRRKMLYCHEQLIVQQYFLNEFLKISLDGKNSIPGVFYNHINRSKYTGGFKDKDLFENVVSFAYQIETESLTTNLNDSKGLFRNYYECWKDYLTFINESVSKLKGEELYFVKLDLSKYYDKLQSYHVRNIFNRCMNDSQLNEEKDNNSFRIGDSENSIDFWLDWILKEAFEYDFYDPNTGVITRKDVESASIPQGPNLSAYIGNICLFGIDEAAITMINNWRVDDNCPAVYARYVDDMVIASNRRDYVTSLVEMISVKLNEINLDLNQEKKSIEKKTKDEIYDELSTQNNPWGSFVSETIAEDIDELIEHSNYVQYTDREDFKKLIAASDFEEELLKKNYENILRAIFKSNESRFNDAVRIVKILIKYYISKANSVEELYSSIETQWKEYIRFSPSDSLLRRDDVYKFAFIEAISRLLKGSYSNIFKIEELTSYINTKNKLSTLITNLSHDSNLKELLFSDQKNLFVLKAKCYSLFCDSINIIPRNKRENNQEILNSFIEGINDFKSFLYLRYFLQLNRHSNNFKIQTADRFDKLESINKFHYFTSMISNIENEEQYDHVCSLYKPVTEKFDNEKLNLLKLPSVNYRDLLDVIFNDNSNTTDDEITIWTSIKYLRINASSSGSILMLSKSKTLNKWIANTEENNNSSVLLPYLQGVGIQSLYRVSKIDEGIKITRFSYTSTEECGFVPIEDLITDNCDCEDLKKESITIKKIISIETYLDGLLKPLEDEGTANLISLRLIDFIIEIIPKIEEKLVKLESGSFPILSYENIYVQIDDLKEDSKIEEIRFITDMYKNDSDILFYWVKNSLNGNFVMKSVNNESVGVIVTEILYDALSKLDVIKYQVRDDLYEETLSQTEEEIKEYECNYNILNQLFLALRGNGKYKGSKSKNSFKATFERYKKIIKRYTEANNSFRDRKHILMELQFENQLIGVLSGDSLRLLDYIGKQEHLLEEWSSKVLSKYNKDLIEFELSVVSLEKLPRRREPSAYYLIGCNLFEESKQITSSLEYDPFKLLGIAYLKMCVKKNVYIQIQELLTVMSDEEFEKLRHTEPNFQLLNEKIEIDYELLGTDGEESYNKRISEVIEYKKLQENISLTFQGLLVLYYQLLEAKDNLSTKYPKNIILEKVKEIIRGINKTIECSEKEMIPDYPYNNFYRCIYDENIKLYDDIIEKLNSLDSLIDMTTLLVEDDNFSYNLKNNRVNIVLEGKFYQNNRPNAITLNKIKTNSVFNIRNQRGVNVFSVTYHNNKIAGISLITSELNDFFEKNNLSESNTISKEKNLKKGKRDIQDYSIEVKTIEDSSIKGKIYKEKGQDKLSRNDQIEESKGLEKKANEEENGTSDLRVIDNFYVKKQMDLWRNRSNKSQEYSRIALFQYDSYCTYNSNIDEIKKFHPYDEIDEGFLNYSQEEMRRYTLIIRAIDICMCFGVEILVLPEYSIRYETMIKILEYLNGIDNINSENRISIWLGTLKIFKGKTFDWILKEYKRINDEQNLYEDEVILPVIMHNCDKYELFIKRSKKYPSIAAEEVFNPQRHSELVLDPIVDSVLNSLDLDIPHFKDARDHVIELICSELFMMSVPSNYSVMRSSSYNLAKRYQKSVDEDKFMRSCNLDTINFGRCTTLGVTEKKYSRKSIVLCPAFTTRPVDHYVISQAGYLGSELTTVFCNSSNEYSKGGSCIIGLNSWDKKRQIGEQLPSYLEYPNSEPGIYHQWSKFSERNALCEKEQTLLIADINPTRAIDSKPRPQTSLSPLRLIAHIPFVEINNDKVRFSYKNTEDCFVNYKDLVSNELEMIKKIFLKDSDINTEDCNEINVCISRIKKLFERTKPNDMSRIFYEMPQIKEAEAVNIIRLSLETLYNYLNKSMQDKESNKKYVFSDDEIYEIAYCLIHLSVLSNSKTLFTRTKKLIESLSFDKRDGFISAYYDFTVVDTSNTSDKEGIGEIYIENQERKDYERERIDFGTYK